MKHILSSVLIFFCCCNAFSQGFNPGIRMGITMPLHPSEYIPEDSQSDRPYELSGRPGFYIGCYGEYNVMKRFSIQTGIGHKSVRWLLFDEKATIGPRPFTYKNQYWNVPLYLKFKKNGFGAYAGAQMEVMISSRAEEGTGAGTGSFGTASYLNTERDFTTEKPVFGIVGIEFTSRRPGIGFEMRYLHGFNPVFKPENSIVLGDRFRKINSRQLELGLHWRFGKDKSRVKP